MKTFALKCVCAVCLALLVLFCGCQCADKPSVSDPLADACRAVRQASTVTKTVTVSSGDFVTATETRSYHAATGEVRIVKRTLNAPGAETLFEETTETREYSGEFGALPFTGEVFTCEGETYRAVLTSAAYTALFPESAVPGESQVEVTLTVVTGRVTEGTVTYTSPEGEHVTVSTAYGYGEP